MPYQQRDVVRVNIDTPLPDGTLANHPFLIISCNAIITNEKSRFYTAVMMTASNHTDRFSFPLDNLMFERRSFRQELLPIKTSYNYRFPRNPN